MMEEQPPFMRRRCGRAVALSDVVSLMHLLLLVCLFVCCCHVRAQQQQLLLHTQDFEVLASVKNSMVDLPGGCFFSTWEFAADIDPCKSFNGVECITAPDGSKRVSSLFLGPQSAGSPGLSGTLTPALGRLMYLTQLSISAGSVQGELPSSLGNLHNLQILSCDQNRVSGRIPGSFSNLRNLEILQLSQNALDGSIPWAIGELPSLKILVLSGNKLSGSIPSFSSLSLVHLDLRNNELSGRIPNLPSSLQYLSLTRNALSGGLGSLVMLQGLNYLDCSFNQFTGSIPSVLFLLQLSYLMLNRNSLSGQVTVTSPININYVDLSYNHLEGTISPFLSGAQSLFLNNNNFVGAVPEVFVSRMQSADLLSLYLQHNFLNDWGALGNSSLPPSVAVCLQYNCLTPPQQSLCPKNIAGAAARPGYQCLKVSGTPGWDQTWASLKLHHCHHICWYIGEILGLGKTE